MNTLSQFEIVAVNGGGGPTTTGFNVGYTVGHWIGTKVGQTIDIVFYLFDGASGILK